MRNIVVQVLGLIFLVLPLVAVQWNLAGSRRRKSNRFVSSGRSDRWRLEIYSNQESVERSLVDRSNIPFPVKEVRSARGRLAQQPGSNAWALPRLELEVDVDDPFNDDVFEGLFGPEHRVLFVTGNEAMLDVAAETRLRVRALPFR